MEEKSYIEKLIQDFLDGYYDGEVTPFDPAETPPFNEETFADFPIDADKNSAWKDFLKYLHDNEYLSQSLINSRDDGESSIAGFITNTADIDHNNKKPIDKLEEDNESLWNESLDALAKQFFAELERRAEDISGEDKEEDTGVSYERGISAGIESVLKHFPWWSIYSGDAGYDFSKQWVRPKHNIDGESYSHVRGTDAIESVLKMNKHLQYTSNRSGQYIRLLMPEYERSVEVEDLNRNFWVIGQVISAICGYLFDEDGVKKILKGILNELIQLWDNILYLWMSIMTISQEQYDLHKEVVVLPNNEIESYIKFDNFEIPNNAEESLYIYNESGNSGVIDKNKLIDRLNYLVGSYTKSNLCLLPIIRENNYYHNYFSKLIIPGLYMYSRENNEWIVAEFKNEEGKSFYLDATSEAFQKRSFGIKEIYDDENGYQYDCIAPISDNQNNYTSLTRLQYKIEETEGGYSVKIDLIDKVISIANPQYGPLLGQIIIDNIKSDVNKSYGEADGVFVNWSKNYIDNEIHEVVPIKQGYYCGELLTCTPHLIWEIDCANAGNLQYVRNSATEIKDNYEAPAFDNLRLSDSETSSAYVKKERTEKNYPNNMIIFRTFNRMVNSDNYVREEEENNDTYSYWIIDGDELVEKDIPIKEGGYENLQMGAAINLKINGEEYSYYYPKYLHDEDGIGCLYSQRYVNSDEIFSVNNKSCRKCYVSSGSGGSAERQVLVLKRNTDSELTENNWLIVIIDFHVERQGIKMFSAVSDNPEYQNLGEDILFTYKVQNNDPTVTLIPTGVADLMSEVKINPRAEELITTSLQRYTGKKNGGSESIKYSDNVLKNEDGSIRRFNDNGIADPNGLNFATIDEDVRPMAEDNDRFIYELSNIYPTLDIWHAQSRYILQDANYTNKIINLLNYYSDNNEIDFETILRDSSVDGFTDGFFIGEITVSAFGPDGLFASKRIKRKKSLGELENRNANNKIIGYNQIQWEDGWTDIELAEIDGERKTVDQLRSEYELIYNSLPDRNYELFKTFGKGFRKGISGPEGDNDDRSLVGVNPDMSFWGDMAFWEMER